MQVDRVCGGKDSQTCGSWFESKQKDEGNNTTTTAAREIAKEKTLKRKEKGHVKRAVGKRGHLARDCFDRFKRQRQ